jgi:hypothetical protein
MVRPHVEGGEKVCRHAESLRIYKINGPGHKSNGGPPALCLVEVLTNSQLKNLQCYQILHRGLVRAVVNTVMNLPVQEDPWSSSN